MAKSTLPLPCFIHDCRPVARYLDGCHAMGSAACDYACMLSVNYAHMYDVCVYLKNSCIIIYIEYLIMTLHLSHTLHDTPPHAIQHPAVSV